jgi:hypothetical protein
MAGKVGDSRQQRPGKPLGKQGLKAKAEVHSTPAKVAPDAPDVAVVKVPSSKAVGPGQPIMHRLHAPQTHTQCTTTKNVLCSGQA